MPRFIDSHAHVQFPVYDADRAEVISRALDADIWMVNVGTHQRSSEAAIRLAQQCSNGVYASAGFHPEHIGNRFHDAWENNEEYRETFDPEAYRELASHPKVVGIGECGLDYFRITNDELRIKEEQRQVFIQQVELAKELGKPLIIHCREAFSDLIEILNSYFLIHNSRPAGVIHFFSGTLEDAKVLIDLGFYLGFGGVVTFAKGYYDVVSAVPLERVVLETDAPYVAPVPYRGKRNEPLYIEATAAKIAEWKEVTVEEVARVTTENARKLFGI